MNKELLVLGIVGLVVGAFLVAFAFGFGLWFSRRFNLMGPKRMEGFVRSISRVVTSVSREIGPSTAGPSPGPEPDVEHSAEYIAYISKLFLELGLLLDAYERLHYAWINSSPDAGEAKDRELADQPNWMRNRGMSAEELRQQQLAGGPRRPAMPEDLVNVRRQLLLFVPRLWESGGKPLPNFELLRYFQCAKFPHSVPIYEFARAHTLLDSVSLASFSAERPAGFTAETLLPGVAERMHKCALAQRRLLTTLAIVKKLADEHELTPDIDEFVGALRERKNGTDRSMVALAVLAGELAAEIGR